VPLTTPKGTTQVPPAHVLRCGEKPYPAVGAGNEATLNFRMSRYGRVQRCEILPDNRFGAIVLVPIGPQGEKLPDGDGKKAKLSVIIWSVLYTPSSYLLDAKASSGRARFFLRCRRVSLSRVPTRDLTRNASPNRSFRSLGVPWRKGLLERRKASSPFQVVAQFT
jgi:hypothetical protein